MVRVQHSVTDTEPFSILAFQEWNGYLPGNQKNVRHLRADSSRVRRCPFQEEGTQEDIP